MDFTLDTYSHICSTLLENYYSNLTVHEFLSTNDPPKKTIILRHDVDRRPLTALRMAELEQSRGLKATYYFRYIRGVFIPEIIEKIEQLGHEVGYHYETLSKCRGNIDKAVSLFAEELEAFRKTCTVQTASMHGRPLSPWDNRLLWKYVNPSQFGLTGEAYLSINYDEIHYFSDTGRTWHPGKYNLRDIINAKSASPILEDSYDLTNFLKKNKGSSICILTHPNRWAAGRLEWMASAGFDFLLNQAKRGLIFIRKSTD